MKKLLSEIKECTICKDYLDLGPRPVVKGHPDSKVVIIGQAPGTKVHASGIPWDDASGKELRRWMDISNEAFYNEQNIAIVPMGFCYPGKGKSGDLPPRPECAPKWHEPVLSQMPNVKLVLLIGMYAQKYYLGKTAQRTLTETVRNYEAYLPNYLPLPHPSPRNRIWMKKNEWFEIDIVPILQQRIREIL